MNRDGVLILVGLILATAALGIVTFGTRVLYVFLRGL